MSVVLHELGLASVGAQTPGGALPARQPGLSRRHLRAVLRASQLSTEPHADKTPPPVGENENVKMELRVGQLTLSEGYKYKNRRRQLVRHSAKLAKTAVNRNYEWGFYMLLRKPEINDLHNAFFIFSSNKRT